MKSKPLARLWAAVTAALAAIALIPRREGTRRGWEYSRFTECPSPVNEHSIAQRKEMVEIQRRIDLAPRIKFRLPERLNKPIQGFGNNCYVGSDFKTEFLHEQKQLEKLLV